MGTVIRLDIPEITARAKANGSDENWELFWSQYPRKKSKLDAMKAWRQTAHIRPPIEELIAALDKQSSSNEWQMDGGQWIPFPAKWLRGGRWMDEE